MSAYNDFMTIATQRYSCRSYSDRRVERDVISLVIDAARLAPSATNRQPWTFHIVDGGDLKLEITACYGREWILEAPALIIAVGDHNAAWHRGDGKDHTDIDIAIAVEHICLAAATLGLGTCWVCNFDAARCARALGLKEGEEPVAIIPIGYPQNSNLPEKKRKPLDDIIKWHD